VARDERRRPPDPGRRRDPEGRGRRSGSRRGASPDGAGAPARQAPVVHSRDPRPALRPALAGFAVAAVALLVVLAVAAPEHREAPRSGGRSRSRPAASASTGSSSRRTAPRARWRGPSGAAPSPARSGPPASPA